MLLCSKTYEIVTQDSAENGEVGFAGFISENESFSFRDLVRELRSYTHFSRSVVDRWTWVTSEPEQDYRSGEHRSESLHFAGPEHKAKYWIKALNYTKRHAR